MNQTAPVRSGVRQARRELIGCRATPRTRPGTAAAAGEDPGVQPKSKMDVPAAGIKRKRLAKCLGRIGKSRISVPRIIPRLLLLAGRRRR